MRQEKKNFTSVGGMNIGEKERGRELKRRKREMELVHRLSLLTCQSSNVENKILVRTE